MSWTLKAAGSIERVKEIVNANEHIPQPVKDVIIANVSAAQIYPPHTGVAVDTYGHVGNLGNIVINTSLIVL